MKAKLQLGDTIWEGETPDQSIYHTTLVGDMISFTYLKLTDCTQTKVEKVEKAEASIRFTRDIPSEPKQKLMPCPLCGGKMAHPVSLFRFTMAPAYARWSFKCNDCDTRIQIDAKSEAEAINRFNTRADAEWFEWLEDFEDVLLTEVASVVHSIGEDGKASYGLLRRLGYSIAAITYAREEGYTFYTGEKTCAYILTHRGRMLFERIQAGRPC